MSKVIEHFLEYVKIDTQSQPGNEQIPSTKKQFDLAGRLAGELKNMGADQVQVTENCYVYASIPATTEKKIPALGFIAHMDTSDALTGAGVRPRLIEDYDGEDICLNREQDIWLRVRDFPFLSSYKGHDLITTDGTTLLGGDDKAGIAEIMTMAEYFLLHPEIPHGPIRIGFTPDEEIGKGADLFDVEGFGADGAYTVDGGALGELQFENFNAASGKVTVRGFGIHPGSAKNKMKNSLLIALEFQEMLPVFENPMYTEGYEGFFHLSRMSGDVEQTQMDYLIRDHGRERFERKKRLFCEAAGYLNKKYGEGTVSVELSDSYYNMKEKIADHMELVSLAERSMRALSIEPVIKPVRGGTDGARLSFMDLPCPNLCTGSRNSHGRYEFASVQQMEKVTELLIQIVKTAGKASSGQE